jgi:hypothetical protein
VARGLRDIRGESAGGGGGVRGVDIEHSGHMGDPSVVSWEGGGDMYVLKEISVRVIGRLTINIYLIIRSC